MERHPQTTQAISDAGGVTAFADIGSGKPFSESGLDDDTGLVFELTGAIKQSHREWLEKQARSKGAYAKRTRLLKEHADGIHCVYGDFRFNSRTKTTKEPRYPFWLNARADGLWEVNEKQAKWINQAFQLNIEGIGTPTIARKLREAGHKLLRGGQITTSYVSAVLRKRSLLGEFWYTAGHTLDGEPIKDCIMAVYPTVISSELFRQAEEARAETGFGRLNPSGTSMLNLFEKRSHCIKCGGLMAVRYGRNEKKAFFCRNKAEGKGCDVPNMPYIETKLLNQVADFRWEDYFGDPKHDAERAAVAAEVERSRR